MTTAIQAILSRYIAEGAFTHAYVGYGVLSESAPQLELLVGPDDRRIFDLASMTKGLVTTPLVFQHARTTNLSLNATVATWSPSLRAELDPRLASLTIRQLLRHESWLPAWRNFWVCHLDGGAQVTREQRHARIVEVLNRVAKEPQTERARPQVYSDLGFLLLTLVLESATGRGIDELFARLSAPGLCYRPGDSSACIPTAFCHIRNRLLTGEVHDENCAALGGVTGHAGLFGEGAAVSRFLHAFCATDLGRDVLAAQAAAIVLPPPSDVTQDSLLGWRQGHGPSTLPFGGGRAVGHPGFTGTVFWIRPDHGDYAVILTNRVGAGRTAMMGIAGARKEILQALAAGAP